MIKICTKCKKNQAREYSCYCPKCQALNQKMYRERHRERINANTRELYKNDKKRFYLNIIKYKYNLNREDYLNLEKKQNGLCCICQEKPKTFVIDHCHKTGKVRSLICRRCNSLIGFAKDSVELLKRAIDYLEYHKNN